MSKNKFFDTVPNSLILIIILMLVTFKILFYVLVKGEVIFPGFGTGSDADYYHAYAEGATNVAVNIWPVLLRYLNDNNLYSREVASYILLFISTFLIPFIMCKLSNLTFKIDQKNYLFLVTICLIYPTLYIFTFDIYRDVFMIFSFLIGCMIFKKSLTSNSLIFMLYFALALIIGFFLLALRPYLGYAFILALFFWKIKFTKKRVVALGVLYFVVLFVANYIGVLDPLTEYRSGFEESGSGSTLGLDFSNPVIFIPNFILSFLGQMFGLYITNPLAIVLFLIETIPFILMLSYVFKNIKLADNFVRFLIIFFVLYASVWLIGNDNLGTAVRLRLYNYLAIYISFFYILRQKSLARKRLQVSNQ